MTFLVFLDCPDMFAKRALETIYGDLFLHAGMI